MLYLGVFLILILVGSYLLTAKLGISREDTNVMWFGIIAFGGVEALARLITALAVGSGGYLAYFILVLIYGAFGYYLFNRSGL